MKPLHEIISRHRSYYAAAIDLDISAMQLKRLVDKGALVNDEGVVFIPSANRIDKDKL